MAMPACCAALPIAAASMLVTYSSPASPGELHVTGVDAAAIGDAAQQAGLAIHQLTTERPDLEAVFLELTAGKAAIR